MGRRSVVTGWAFADAGPFGETTTVSLYDGATAVPVYSQGDPRGVITVDGPPPYLRWKAVVCCGPAAPHPACYACVGCGWRGMEKWPESCGRCQAADRGFMPPVGGGPR